MAKPTDAQECAAAEATQDRGSRDTSSNWTVAFGDALHPVDEPIVLYVCRAIGHAATE